MRKSLLNTTNTLEVKFKVENCHKLCKVTSVQIILVLPWPNFLGF